ncbi:AbrB/MazE/SpoVT family DNA-binding domain-containing protein [Sporosarcina oncorhynchi]|uniref:AbrB/MazE/SpoVT family DNA-binding domain-containing protein n=1 Tax=Sporosarcina oncorhynchi TaxID=3056444 RepID=A0ABZ0L7C0_9BACL|nr:AbrB/MazE/SpoVT family DNA-binding domain-containing protein [Sporosarcina sp. T2O-4]WOV88464.1 AbrB/MazE/SpoVT family DNA-binding domain-containing protein [Sporosarcina sp. T2O-4]
MRSLGIVRKVDHLGRIVIPKELRNSLHLEKGAPMEIFVDEDMIILRKYVVDEACIVTGEITPENTKLSNGMYISPRGAEILKKEIADNKKWN